MRLFQHDKWFGAIITTVLFCLFTTAIQAQDIIVTNDGESIKAYNVEIGQKNVFFQRSPELNSEIKRIDKKTILIIRMADGTKIDPNATTEQASRSAEQQIIRPRGLREPLSHEPQTAKAIRPEKGKITYSVATNNGNTIYCRILSKEQRTMSIAKGKYKKKEYILPEYVEVEGLLFTITEIDDRAFMRTHVENVTFPLTLKKIGDSAFDESHIQKVLLPEGIESVGAYAFAGRSGFSHSIDEIYLPTTLKYIGKNCFLHSGMNQSPMGKYQDRISCLPFFLTLSNCDNYGIDDSAVQAYYDNLRALRTDNN